MPFFLDDTGPRDHPDDSNDVERHAELDESQQGAGPDGTVEMMVNGWCARKA
jgi:hypothetical protein